MKQIELISVALIVFISCWNESVKKRYVFNTYLLYLLLNEGV